MKIGIIGGTRGLGKTIAIFLKKEGHEITITGRDSVVGTKVSKEIGVSYSNDNKKVASLNEIVIVSVPIDFIKDVITEIANYLKSGSLLLDVASVKEKPTNIMNQYIPDNVEFIPTHPIFGPRTTSLEGQLIVLTPINKGQWYNRIVSFLKRYNVRILEVDPKEHDKMMAVVQVLTHFSYISIASTISKLKVDIKTTREFASPIYNLMVDIIARITSQNPFLTYSIQKENEWGENVRKVFAESVIEIKDILSNNQENEFVEIVTDAIENMDDISSALGRSDKAVDSLTRELVILNDSIKKEICVKYIYSNKVYCGVLTEITPDFIILKNLFRSDTSSSNIKLKISSIELLSDIESRQWKKNNLSSKSYKITALFSKNSKPNIIKDTIKMIPNIVDVKILDISRYLQTENEMISIIFSIETYDKKSLFKVENLLKGFGAIII
jgi:prephenate dehydrogenase